MFTLPPLEQMGAWTALYTHIHMHTIFSNLSSYGSDTLWCIFLTLTPSGVSGAHLSWLISTIHRPASASGSSPLSSDFTRSGSGGEVLFANHSSILSKGRHLASSSPGYKQIERTPRWSSFYYSLYYVFIKLGKHLCKG